MLGFNWDVTDFIACLEVEPFVEEYEVCHVFEVEKDGIRILLSVYQYEGDVCFTLYRDGVENPVFNMTLTDCEGARYVNERGIEFLEFAPSKCFGSRYDGHAPIAFGVRLSVKPSISIDMFGLPV